VEVEQIAIFDVLRRHLAMIIAVPLIAALAGYASTFLMTDQYKGTAVVLVRPQQQIKMGTGKETREFLDFAMGNAAVETASKTYIEIIKSSALLGEVVRELGLDNAKDDEGDKSRVLPAFLRPSEYGLSLKRLILLLKYGKLIEDDPFTKAVKEVSGGLKAEAQLDTYIFEITYAGKDPQRVADVVNAVAKTLIRFVNKLGSSEALFQRDRLKTELEQRGQDLTAARQQVENYKRTRGVFLPTSEYDAKLKLITELEVELAKAQSAMAAGQNTLSAGGLEARRGSLMRVINERRAELAPMPQIERELTQLQDDVKFASAAYELVEKEFKEADLKAAYTAPEASLVSHAVPPNLPSSPVRGTIALAALLGGVVVAVSLAFLFEYLNRRVRGIRDVEEFVGVKVLATIPHVSSNRWRQAALA
jgi:uncharacterized protein involved in exopolysaccharide biosynthesis